MKMPSLPMPYREKGWTIDEIARSDLFTAEQMRAYGEAVREACAKVCEDEAGEESSYDAAHYLWCASSIRSDQD